MSRKEKIAIVCGDYDPLSYEDLKFLQICKSKADWLVVGVHSDHYLMSNKGGYMQDYPERCSIIQALSCVDEVFHFNDSNGNVSNLLRLVKACYPHAEYYYVSENDMHNAPETKIKGITFVTMKQE